MAIKNLADGQHENLYQCSNLDVEFIESFEILSSFRISKLYTSSLKIGTPKNREFRENLAFFKTCDLLKIGNLGKF